MQMPQITRNKQPQIKQNQVFLSARMYASQQKSVTSKASAYATCTGSLTLEATLVLPIFVLAMIFFLFYFQVLMMETKVEQALQYTSRTMAVYAGVGLVPEGDSDGQELLNQAKGQTLMSKSVAKGMVCAQLTKSGAQTKYIKNGLAGLKFSHSDFSGDYVDLIVTYRMKLFRQGSGIEIVQRARTHKWTGDHGYTEEKADETIVYITPTGKAYHATKSCPYLDLSIRSVSASSVASRRNKNGGKYYACSRCGKGVTKGMVYITDYGTDYHADRGCSGLKRTVMEVARSEVGSRTPCKKCAGK